MYTCILNFWAGRPTIHLNKSSEFLVLTMCTNGVHPFSVCLIPVRKLQLTAFCVEHAYGILCVFYHDACAGATPSALRSALLSGCRYLSYSEVKQNIDIHRKLISQDSTTASTLFRIFKALFLLIIDYFIFYQRKLLESEENAWKVSA